MNKNGCLSWQPFFRQMGTNPQKYGINPLIYGLLSSRDVAIVNLLSYAYKDRSNRTIAVSANARDGKETRSVCFLYGSARAFPGGQHG